MSCPCCNPCSGPCSSTEQCAPGCTCVEGECVKLCEGPCNDAADCPPGCLCVDGQCFQPCCFSGINCDIVVTVTYSNGQTRTNGEFEIGYDGNNLATTIGYTVIDCNTVRFAHEIIPWIGPGQLFECFQVAVKEQKVDCTTCCEDGTACDCTIGDVVAESYEPFGGLGDCSDQPTTVHVTGISITLANCGECPCNPLP